MPPAAIPADLQRPGLVEAIRRDDTLGVLQASRRTREGFLQAEGIIARPGILEYKKADGSTWRELVPRSTLHDRRSLDTLGGKPMTIDHPDDDVSPESFQALGVGAIDPTIDVLEPSGFVRIRFIVQRQDAIDTIDAGTQELSPGYKVLLDMTAGEDPEFGHFDATQIFRDYNHGAIVPRARGGREVRMRVDSDEVLIPVESAPLSAPPPPAREVRMPAALTLNGKTLQILTLLGVTRFDSDEAALEEGAVKAQEMKDAVAEKTDEVTLSPEEITALQEKVTKLEADLATANAELATLRKEKLDAATAAAVAANKADRKNLDSLAVRLGVEVPAPRKDAAGRVIDPTAADNDALAAQIVKAAGITLPDGATRDQVRGALLAVQTMHRDDAAADELPDDLGGGDRGDGAYDLDGEFNPAEAGRGDGGGDDPWGTLGGRGTRVRAQPGGSPGRRGDKYDLGGDDDPNRRDKATGQVLTGDPFIDRLNADRAAKAAGGSARRV